MRLTAAMTVTQFTASHMGMPDHTARSLKLLHNIWLSLRERHVHTSAMCIAYMHALHVLDNSGL